jgi:hypothetical protein
MINSRFLVSLICQFKTPELILLSPIAVVLLGQLAARTLGPIIGIWSWVPGNIGYWSIILLFVAWGGGREEIAGWLGHLKEVGIGAVGDTLQ